MTDFLHSKETEGNRQKYITMKNFAFMAVFVIVCMVAVFLLLEIFGFTNYYNDGISPYVRLSPKNDSYHAVVKEAHRIQDIYHRNLWVGDWAGGFAKTLEIAGFGLGAVALLFMRSKREFPVPVSAWLVIVFSGVVLIAHVVARNTEIHSETYGRASAVIGCSISVTSPGEKTSDKKEHALELRRALQAIVGSVTLELSGATLGEAKSQVGDGQRATEVGNMTDGDNKKNEGGPSTAPERKKVDRCLTRLVTAVD